MINNNDMRPLYVSYYTRHNGYDIEARQLIETLERFALPYCIEGVGQTDWSWQRATQHKAQFIYDRLLEFADRALVWIDADARVLAYPALFDNLNCDIAAHWFQNRELLSGTLYFGPGRVTTSLVEQWIALNQQPSVSRCAEQQNLQCVIESGCRARVVRLPPEYAWIDAGTGRDLSWRAYGERTPIILHTQASRRLRRAR